jgi:hypothetical protein
MEEAFSTLSVSRCYSQDKIADRIYSLFKSERLSMNIKLTLHKTLIRSVITFACPAFELAADTHLLKLLRLQNKVLRTTGNFPRCTPVRDLHSISTFRMYTII